MNFGRSILLVALVMAAAVRAAELPQFKVPSLPLVPGCIQLLNAENGAFTTPARWERICPLDEFLDRVKREKIESPGFQLIIADLLHDEVLKARAQVLEEFVQRPREAAVRESKLFNVFHELFQPPTPAMLPMVPFESAEGTILAKTQPLVEAAEEHLRPLFAQPNPTVLAGEASLSFLKTLGDSLRFSAAAEHLATNWSQIQPASLQKEALTKIIDWVEVYGAAPVRPWLRAKLEVMRSTEITGAKTEQLTYWLKSLELAGPPLDKDTRAQLLGHLRELAVAYPVNDDQFKIKTIAEKLGVGAAFLPPQPRGMNFKELLVRAHSQVKYLDGNSALRTLQFVQSLPAKEVDQEDLWSALQLHARVLRITDQREQIPALLKAYLKTGKFMDPPRKKDTAETQKFFTRGVEIARMTWSYDTADRAQEVTQKFLKIARRLRSESAIGQFMYLKARMAEQQRDSARAQPVFTEALATHPPADLMSDLMWRNLLLNFDIARETRNAALLFPLFDPLKKYLSDPVDRARWHYWQGKAYALDASFHPVDVQASLVSKATDEFDKSYKAEPYSFYSDLSGVELAARGRKPKDWVLASNADYTTPDWAPYFSSKGVPTQAVYKDLARMYLLASVGDFERAQVVAQEMDPALWDRVLSAKSPIKDKKKYVRAVAWLRIAMQDPMGSLKVAEIARQAYGADFEPEDFLYLYPLPYWKIIQDEATQRNVNPWLAASLMRQESAFNPRAKSGANALGLMQMIPSVANAEAKALGLENFSLQDLYRPPVALKLGISHLSHRVHELEDSWICASAAYNAGTPPIRKWLMGYDTTVPVAFIERIPFTETRNYVRAILRNYMNYQRIYAGGTFDLDALLKMPKSRAREIKDEDSDKP